MPDPTRLHSWFSRTVSFPEAVLPRYEGGSIANVAASIVRSWTGGGVEDGMLPSISDDLLDPALLSGSRVIVMIVIDGFGQLNYDPDGERFRRVTRSPDVRTTITSVFPSTTAAALTTLQTGIAPATHGLAGYTMNVPAAGRVMNMIQFKPVDGTDALANVLDPAAFVSQPTIFERMSAVGVDCEVISHREYARSPLTIVHSGDTPYSGHRTLGEFVALLDASTRKAGRRFVFAYWAGVDMLAHTYGPMSSACQIEAALIERSLIDHVVEPILARSDDVTIVVTADHGLAEVPERDAVPLHELTKTVGVLRPPTGERRAVGLTLGSREARDALAAAVDDDAVVIDANDAIEAGLYGPRAHPELSERIGDTLLLARGKRSFPFRPLREQDQHSPGAHGSLTPEEMMVPLYVWRSRS